MRHTKLDAILVNPVTGQHFAVLTDPTEPDIAKSTVWIGELVEPMRPLSVTGGVAYRGVPGTEIIAGGKPLTYGVFGPEDGGYERAWGEMSLQMLEPTDYIVDTSGNAPIIRKTT